MDVSEKHFWNLESVPMSCGLGLENLNSNELWLFVAVGFESGNAKELKLVINKKKMSDKSFFQVKE